MKSRGKVESGQALLELVVILMVLGLIITAVIGVVTNSVRNARGQTEHIVCKRFPGRYRLRVIPVKQ
ncbi:MAG: hypothetical protein HYW33_02025 [Candidatus Blackburnbacteria bacterium]|nr:hypothetical protein [Candidatus Blackburnbacteria bacterium]